VEKEILASRFMQDNFSPEMTMEEGIIFLVACPTQSSIPMMIAVYLALIAHANKTPYLALYGVMVSYIGAFIRLREELGNEN